MWQVLSILLIIWVIYDLFTGEVWSYYRIKRSEEPGKYWFFMLVWAVVALGSAMVSFYSWY